MTETGLLIAEAAFLVLLFLFIWSIVRSSHRDLEEAGPLVASPAGDPVRRQVDTAPAPAKAPPPAPVEAAADALPSRERPTGPALDLSVNIRPRLVVEKSPSLAQGAEYPLEAGLTIGRARANGIALSDQFVSYMHARVFPNGQFFFIEDLGSTNGTFVNGRKIDGQAQLKVRDEVRFGDTMLRYEE